MIDELGAEADRVFQMPTQIDTILRAFEALHLYHRDWLDSMKLFHAPNLWYPCRSPRLPWHDVLPELMSEVEFRNQDLDFDMGCRRVFVERPS